MKRKNSSEFVEENLKSDKDTTDLEHCCDKPTIETRDGHNVCLNCGMIRGPEIVSQERRAYSMEELSQRKRTELAWRDFGPRTYMSDARFDCSGRNIGSKRKTLYSRLSKIQNSLISSLERNFWEAKPKLKMLSSRLNIPNYIRETAWKIYNEVAKRKLTMGRSIDSFLTAALYAAIRIHEFPRLLDEVYDASLNSSRHSVHRALGMIVKDVLPELGLRYKPITSEQLVFRFGNELNLDM